MVFDRNLAKQIQEASEKALAEVAKKYGVTIKSAGGTLGENDFSMKMKVEVEGAVKTYPDYVFTLYGLPNDVIGKTFMSNGILMTVKEFATKSPKYPIICSGNNGKEYKFTVDSVKAMLKLK